MKKLFIVMNMLFAAVIFMAGCGKDSESQEFVFDNTVEFGGQKTGITKAEFYSDDNRHYTFRFYLGQSSEPALIVTMPLEDDDSRYVLSRSGGNDGKWGLSLQDAATGHSYHDSSDENGNGDIAAGEIIVTKLSDPTGFCFRMSVDFVDGKSLVMNFKGSFTGFIPEPEELSCEFQYGESRRAILSAMLDDIDPEFILFGFSPQDIDNAEGLFESDYFVVMVPNTMDGTEAVLRGENGTSRFDWMITASFGDTEYEDSSDPVGAGIITSGKVLYQKIGDETYYVSMNIVFSDGKVLEASYSGSFKKDNLVTM